MSAGFSMDIEVKAGTGLNVPDTHAMVLLQIHRVAQYEQFGIDFPKRHEVEGKQLLGTVLRVMAQDRATLQRFHTELAACDAEEFVVLRPVEAVAEMLTSVCRHKPKSMGSRERRRIRRQGAAYTEEERQVIAQRNDALHELPFLRMESQSRRTQFHLFIKPCSPREVSLHNNGYGL